MTQLVLNVPELSHGQVINCTEILYAWLSFLWRVKYTTHIWYIVDDTLHQLFQGKCICAVDLKAKVKCFTYPCMQWLISLQNIGLYMHVKSCKVLLIDNSVDNNLSLSWQLQLVTTDSVEVVKKENLTSLPPNLPAPMYSSVVGILKPINNVL